MLLKLARAAFNRGWLPVYEFLLELDCSLARLAGASRRIKRKREGRRDLPFVVIGIEGPR